MTQKIEKEYPMRKYLASCLIAAMLSLGLTTGCRVEVQQTIYDGLAEGSAAIADSLISAFFENLSLALEESSDDSSGTK
jgi:hypothetical protein